MANSVDSPEINTDEARYESALQVNGIILSESYVPLKGAISFLERIDNFVDTDQVLLKDGSKTDMTLGDVANELLRMLQRMEVGIDGAREWNLAQRSEET